MELYTKWHEWTKWLLKTNENHLIMTNNEFKIDRQSYYQHKYNSCFLSPPRGRRLSLPGKKVQHPTETIAVSARGYETL